MTYAERRRVWREENGEASQSTAEPYRETGFFLAVFAFGEPHPGQRFNYISNADMLDVRATLADILARLEGRAQNAGRA